MYFCRYIFSVFSNRKYRSAGRDSRVSQSDPNPTFRHEAIPEGVAVIHGDPSKTKMPLFGKLTI